MIRSTIDRALDAAVLPSYTSFGYGLRKLMFRWRALPRMAGKTVLVTGATSGLGAATAEILARLGARVLLLVRDGGKGEAVRARIAAATGNEGLEVHVADLSSMASVRRAAATIATRERSIDVLVHNAGALLEERTLSEDGHEMSFATMVLGPFVLTEELLPLLRAAGGARIVTVSSGGMYTQPLVVEPQGPKRYRGSVAYARAKRAQVALTELWAERYAPDGIVAHAMHPGWADTPGVKTSLPRFYRALKPALRTALQGADTIAWLAASEEAGRSTGKFWLDRRPRPTHRLKRTRATGKRKQQLWDTLERIARGGEDA